MPRQNPCAKRHRRALHVRHAHRQAARVPLANRLRAMRKALRKKMAARLRINRQALAQLNQPAARRVPGLRAAAANRHHARPEPGLLSPKAASPERGLFYARFAPAQLIPPSRIEDADP